MGIVDDDIERVRDASPLADVVQQYVALRRVGRRATGLCPFHAEKTPSFSVNEEIGRYYCFGCGAKGDVFAFVQDLEHLDFAGAVEWLANRSGITLRYTTGGEGRDRQRRKRLVEAMAQAVEWYHQRLLTAADARPARDYLRARGIGGDVARQFRLGWAPDDWDTLVRESGLTDDLLRDAGLAFSNRRDRLQDAFRARVMFPIFNEVGEAVAFGGRVLPGSTDPAKYKNSPETAVYTKSKTLYGLALAKAEIVQTGQVVVCEGYTDVIGFHRAGIGRAVATCGTALTEDHVRLLKRYANNVVLAFDADAAGLAAAERFYEWERAYELSVSVAGLPAGVDPGELAGRAPEALVAAVDRRSTVPRLPPRSGPGCRQHGDQRSAGRRRRGRPGGGQRASQRARAQAVRRRGGHALWPRSRRPGASREPSAPAAARRGRQLRRRDGRPPPSRPCSSSPSTTGPACAHGCTRCSSTTPCTGPPSVGSTAPTASWRARSSRPSRPPPSCCSGWWWRSRPRIRPRRSST